MGWATNYYRFHLGSQCRSAYGQILAAWLGGRYVVTLDSGHLGSREINATTAAVAYDHPEIFWINYYTYSIKTSPWSTELEYGRFFADWEINVLKQEAVQWRSDIVSQLAHQYGKEIWAWQIYDYLARKVVYCKQCDSYSQTIVGPMSPRNHRAVCEGIAKAYKYLCDAAGVECILAIGNVCAQDETSGPHAWNIIGYQGAFRHVDVTAELQRAKHKGIAGIDAEFAKCDCAMDAYSWDHALLPQCV